MGMSSSQARLLTLTARQHSIEYKAQRIQAEKLRLANDSDRIYNEYLDALDATKIQFKSINNDGSTTYIDATLNALENGAVSNYTGITSNETFLLYNGAENTVLVTPEFANAYGITGGKVQPVGDLDDYLTQHGCTKVEDTKTVTNTNYNDIQAVTPVQNQIVSTPSQTTVNDGDTYSISGNLSTPVDNSTAASTSYTVSGSAPTVNSVAGIPTQNTKTVITSGVDASSQTMSTSTTSNTETTKFEYLIPSNQKIRVIESTTYSLNKDDLNLTMQQLSDKYGWNFNFDDSNETIYGNKFNSLYASYNISNLANNYGLGSGKTTNKIQYTSTTTLSDLLTQLANSTNEITFDKNNGTITGSDKYFQFSSYDDKDGNSYTDDLAKYLNNSNKSYNYGPEQTFNSNTKMVDMIQSDKQSGNYGDFRINNMYGNTYKVDSKGNYILNSSGGKINNCTWSNSASTLNNEYTYKDYLNYIASDSEMKAAGFQWYEDSEGIHAVIGNGYKIEMLTYADSTKFNGQLTDEKTTTNTTSVELNRNAIAENIYLARSIVNGTKADDYNANHTSSVNAILNEMKSAYNNYSTDENKRQLTLFSEELSTALASGDKTQIQNALAKLGQTITSDKYAKTGAETKTESGSNNNKTITVNKTVNNVTYTFNDSNVSITPNTTEVSDGQTDNPGTLTVGSNSDMEKYLAYQLYQYNNGQSYENYLSNIQAQGYNAYQLAELVENFNTYKAQLAAGTNLTASLTKYDAANYNLVQSNSNNYNVTNNSTAATHEVTVANTDDILDRLAYDIYTQQGRTGNPNTIKTQLSGALNNTQLASLSSYYGTNTWNTIVSNLANNMNANSVSNYTTKYNGYNITYRTSNDVTINTNSNSHQETIKGKLNVPTIEGIASNLVIAFRKAGKTIDEAELKQKLEAKYGSDNNSNNLTLANINEVICNYLNNGNNAGVENIYNNIYNNSTLTINSTYTADKYDASRANLGLANVTYGTTTSTVKTGTWHWQDDDNYKKWYSQYQKLKAMEEYQFEIVDANLCNKNEFVNNYITQAGASLLTFNVNEDGSFEMIGASVATKTSLRETANEINLKKAEAKYEADMDAINKKDTKYDTQLAVCETERNAIKEEVDSLKNVIKDNVDRTFKLFS